MTQKWKPAWKVCFVTTSYQLLGFEHLELNNKPNMFLLSLYFQQSHDHPVNYLDSDSFISNVNHHHPSLPPFYSIPVAPSKVLKWNQAPPHLSSSWFMGWSWKGLMIFPDLAGRLVWGFCISINRSTISISDTSYIYTPGMISSHCYWPLLPSSWTFRLVVGETSFPIFLLLLLSLHVCTELVNGYETTAMWNLLGESVKVMKVLTSGVC